MASLREPSAAASVAGSASAGPERPRRRLDDTEADEQSLIKPYQKCMKSHGITSEKELSGWGSGAGLPKELGDAQKACELFWPLPPWEQDPANPEAKDFTRAVVKCLKRKGVTYVEAAADGIGISAGGDQNDARSISMTGDLLDDCQREVAAGK